MSRYWENVGKKLISFGKTVVSVAGPAAIDAAIVTAVSKVCGIIEEKLKSMYRRTLINSAISFCINAAGLVVLIFKPFGISISKYVAFSFFTAAFIITLVRMILFLKNYGRQTFEITKSVVKEKSVSKGIESYTLTAIPDLSLIYSGIDLGANFLPKLKEIPRISQLVKYLVKIFWKRLAVFFGIVAVYTVAFFWIIKPLLVKKYL